MKKVFVLIISALLVVFFFPKPYISSPGLTTPQEVQEFNKPNCIGYSFLTNAMEAAADAPGRSLCFGWLK